MGLLHKLCKPGPEGESGLDGPAPVGVIIRNCPSSGGVEHEVSSRGTCLVDGQVKKGGGGRIDKVPPHGHKHVPYVIGNKVHPLNGDGLGANIAKVRGLVKGASSVKEQQLGRGVTRVDGLLQKAKGREKGGEDGHILLTLDGFILEVGGHEGGMLAMPVLVVLDVVLIAVGMVPATWVDRKGVPMGTSGGDCHHVQCIPVAMGPPLAVQVPKEAHTTTKGCHGHPTHLQCSKRQWSLGLWEEM